MAALKNGMGLTLSATFILRHPKDISKIIQADDDLHKECIEAMKFSAKALLVISNDHLEKRAFGRWFTNNAFLRQFRTELVFWGCKGDAKKMTYKQIIAAYYRYRDMSETATSISLLEADLIQHIIDTPELYNFFSEKNVI